MGCDIHIATQIKKNGVWEYIDEIPNSLDNRNYHLFAFLADVRNKFCIKGFNPKGLPEDIGSRKYRFISERDVSKRVWETNKSLRIKMPDGSYRDLHDEIFKIYFGSDREGAKQYDIWKYDNGIYTVYDYKSLGGEKVEVPLKELYDFEEFYKERCKDSFYDEEVQDYGYWKIDFDCCDYHSHSWLTLEELLNCDKTDYFTSRCYIPSLFYIKFIELGGIFPEGITKIEMSIPDGIPENLREKFLQLWEETNDVLISIDNSSKKEETALIKGIHELEDIAKKYVVGSSDIRIVFTFDN